MLSRFFFIKLLTLTWSDSANAMFLEFSAPSSTCCLHPRISSCHPGTVVTMAAVLNGFKSLRGRLSRSSGQHSSPLLYFQHQNIGWVPGNSSHQRIRRYDATSTIRKRATCNYCFYSGYF
ncbi:hypothetical protein F4805DRAFT_184657 [Annulohypoxylon moriforme]|nr:hypothetical protein F4805DRAFT_184657 [Annulohypoxylon moriforme]